MWWFWISDKGNLPHYVNFQYIQGTKWNNIQVSKHLMEYSLF